jgi:signal-transduction protein with cAMP-binding, CBS, and nucleotidyltransferase domain
VAGRAAKEMPMSPEYEAPQKGDEGYFDETKHNVFDATLLREPLDLLPTRSPLVFSRRDSVSAAMNAMQMQHRGCVLITEDGTTATPLVGIFTERDVLNRIIGQGRNPALIRLEEVMHEDPESLPTTATVAWVLNKMSVGGFRHVPVVDDEGRLAFVISVRDVVQFMVDHFPSEILNLPPDFEMPNSQSREGA